MLFLEHLHQKFTQKGWRIINLHIYFSTKKPTGKAYNISYLSRRGWILDLQFKILIPIPLNGTGVFMYIYPLNYLNVGE